MLKKIPSNPFVNFDYNFWQKIQISNGFSQVKFILIYQLFLVQSFKKNYYIMTKLGLKIYLQHNSNFVQWGVKLFSSNFPISFEDSWWTIGFSIKSTSLTYLHTIYQLAYSIILSPNLQWW